LEVRFVIFNTGKNEKRTVDNLADKDAFVETLLQERDELYQELSKLRQIDGGALAQAEKKIAQFQKAIEEKDRLIKKLTDQLA
jgi:hypothetical protein